MEEGWWVGKVDVGDSGRGRRPLLTTVDLEREEKGKGAARDKLQRLQLQAKNFQLD